MARRLSTEEIIRKLAEADRLQAEGLSSDEIADCIGTTPRTLAQWRKRHQMPSSRSELDILRAEIRHIRDEVARRGRQLAEESMREREKRYRALFENNPQPMFVYDLETLRFLDVNNAAIVQYGYSRDEFLAMTIADIRPLEDVPALLQNVEHVTEGLDRAGVWRHRLRDGRLIWVEISSHTMDYDGRRAEMVLVSDITARVQAEEKLRTSEARYRAIVENEPECVKIVSADGILVDMNPAGLQIIEADDGSQVLGQPVHKLVHPDDLDAFTLLHRRVCRGESGRLQFRMRGLRGTTRWLESHSAPLRGPDGKVSAVLSVTRDITEARRAERMLLRSEAMMRIASRIGRMGAWRVDADTLKLTWSDEVRRIHEVDDDYVPVVEEGINFYAPECRETLRQAYEDCLYRGIPYDLELQIITARGRRVWVRTMAEAARDDSGRILAVQGAFQDISDRMEREAELLERESLQRIAGKVARVGGWTVEMPDYHVKVSPEIHEMLGYTPGTEWTVEEGLERYPPATREVVTAALMKCLQEGVAYDLEVEVLTKTMEPRWARITGESVRDKEGRIIAVHGSLQDITEQVQRESEIRRRDALLRIAGNIARVGGWTVDMPDYHMTLADEIYQMYGYPPGTEWTLEEGMARYSEETQKVVSDALNKCLHEGVPFDIEVETWSATLDPMWVRVRGEAIRDASGTIVAAHGAFQDVSARKDLDARLAESEERFRHVAQATLDTIWDWDLTTDLVWWNSGIQTQFGYPPDDLEPDSRSWTSRIHPEDLDRVTHSIHAAIDGHGDGNKWESKYRFRRRDGKYAQVVDRGFVIRDSSGKAIRMVGGMTDITERVALEDQLRQSQKLESVGQLTGGIAHDFNNLLTVIRGNAELLIEELEDDEDKRSLADMISAAAERGAALTHRLLAFARRQALDPRSIDLNQLVSNIDHLLRRTLGDHIEVEFVRAAGLWKAMVDPAQLESALLNLCINARDAMPTGGRLTIETANVRINQEYADQHPDLKAGQYVMVAVSDTGSGIPHEHLEHVFEPFYTTKEPGKGTGLGLSMVYGFVKQSHGHVKLYSEENEGTTIKMYLPRVTQLEEEAAAPVEAHPERIGEETILLVEDDELVRRYALSQLEVLGYRVLVAENAQRALEFVRQRDDIDLLFTDVVMPGGMNGRQLADAAREIRPGLKVLYTSGYTDNAIVHQGRLDPGAQLLTKPYGRAELARKLREVLAEG